jgi:hypothetical protein
VTARRELTLLEIRRRAIALLIAELHANPAGHDARIAEIRQRQARLRFLIECEADRESPFRWVDRWDPISPSAAEVDDGA